MSAEDDPKKIGANVSVGNLNADRDIIVIGQVHQLMVQLVSDVSSPLKQASHRIESPTSDPRPDLTSAALVALSRRETCIYVGRRYGLTPHARLSWRPLEEGAYRAPAPGYGPLCEAMSLLFQDSGRDAAARNLAEVYGRLDQVEPEAEAELEKLAPLVAGHLLATGSYSARIQRALGPDLTVAQTDQQATAGLFRSASKRARLLMLHGSEHDFANALLDKNTIRSFSRCRPEIAASLSALLRETWIVLGADAEEDQTFNSVCNVVSGDLGSYQRPIFVVDPRPEETVAAEWPREALRHLRMSPARFLELAEAKA